MKLGCVIRNPLLGTKKGITRIKFLTANTKVRNSLGHRLRYEDKIWIIGRMVSNETYCRILQTNSRIRQWKFEFRNRQNTSWKMGRTYTCASPNYFLY